MGVLSCILSGKKDINDAVLEIVERWLRGAENNVDKWLEGLECGYEKWKPNLLRFLNSTEARKYFTDEMIQRIKAGVETITPEEFKASIIGKQDAYINNMRNSQEKYAMKMIPLLQYEAQVLREIQNIQDPEQRMIQWRRKMMEYKKKKAQFVRATQAQAQTILAYV